MIPCAARKFMLTAAFLLAVIALSAQRAKRDPPADSVSLVGDSIATPRPDTSRLGVITVRRPPIPASFRVSVFYLYPDSQRTREHSLEFTPTEIIFSDSLFDPWEAQPIYVGSNWTSDRDSVLLVNEMAAGFPQGPFNWEKYLATMQYGFAWTDSTRSDSARFEFTLDKKGRATVRLLPWAQADSSCRVFEKRSTQYMGRLRQWYPARRMKNARRKKLRNVACIAIVTLYAYDPLAGRYLPINVIKE